MQKVHVLLQPTLTATHAANAESPRDEVMRIAAEAGVPLVPVASHVDAGWITIELRRPTSRV